MRCISTTTFKICLSNEVKGNIHPQRGVCQGHPLSSNYLFFVLMFFQILLVKLSNKIDSRSWFQWE